MNKKFTLHTLLILVFLLFLSKSQALAQQAQPFELGITPSTAYIHVEPGKELTHNIIIRNEGIFSLNITPHLIDFDSDQKSGTPVLEKNTLINILKSKLVNFQKQRSSPGQTDSNLQTNSELINYLSFSNPDVIWNEEFTLKPGEEKNIAIKVAPPATEPLPNTTTKKTLENSQVLEKEHHLTIIFAASNKFSTPNNNSYAQISGVVASNLIAFFSNEKNDSGKLMISKISVPKVIDSFSQISFSVLAKNQGKNATPNSGRAFITNLSNNTLSEYVFYPDMILANSSRESRGIKKEIWDEINKKNEKQPEDQEQLNLEVVSQLTTNFKYKSPFLFGIYNINVELGEETKNTKIIALPLSIFALAFIAFLTYFSLKILKKILRN